MEPTPHHQLHLNVYACFHRDLGTYIPALNNYPPIPAIGEHSNATG